MEREREREWGGGWSRRAVCFFNSGLCQQCRARVFLPPPSSSPVSRASEATRGTWHTHSVRVHRRHSSAVQLGFSSCLFRFPLCLSVVFKQVTQLRTTQFGNTANLEAGQTESMEWAPTGWTMPGKDRPTGWTMPGKDRPTGWTMPGKDRPSGWTIPGKDRPTGWTIPGKDRPTGWTIPGKDRPSGWTVPGKDRPTGWTKPGKDRPTGWTIPEKDRPTGWTIPGKDRPTGWTIPG